MNKINRKKTLSVYPDIEEIEYRSNIDSVKLNRMLRSIQESSLRGLIRGREINSELQRLDLGVIKAYQAMEARTNSLNYSVKPPTHATTDEDIDISTLNNQYAVASTYEVKKDLTSTGSILYDIPYGYSTLNPIGSYSKVPRGDGYDGRVSPQVQIWLDGNEVDVDSELYDALDGTNTSFWIKEVAANSEHTITISLPPSLTKRFNYIEVFPFPIFGMVIQDILYEDVYARQYSVQSDLYGMNPLQNNVGESIKLHLAPRESNGTFHFKVKATSLGVIGFSNIDIKFLDFDNNTKKGFLKFDTLSNFPTNTEKVRTIYLDSVDVDFMLDGPRSNTLVSTTDQSPIKVWLKTGEFQDGQIVPTGASLQQTTVYPITLSDRSSMFIGRNIRLSSSEDLWLVFELREHNITTPVIRGAKVIFNVTTTDP